MLIKKYWKANVIALPIHLLLLVGLFFSVYLSSGKNDWYIIGGINLLQVYVVGLIPNMIIYLKNRKENGNHIAFIKMSLLILCIQVVTVLIVGTIIN